MAQLLAMSYDCPSYPSITLETGENEMKYRFSLASYTAEGNQANIIKNIKTHHKRKVLDELTDNEYFTSTIFLSTLLHENEYTKNKNDQPYSFSFGGRDWIFAISGEIYSDCKEILKLTNPIFSPKSNSRNEYVFSWLLEQLYNKNEFSLSETNLEKLHTLLQTINNHGQVNMILSDGENVVAYHDKNNFEPLFLIKSIPPHRDENQLNFDKINITMNALDLNHSAILISNSKIIENNDLTTTSYSMTPGQMTVIRRAEIVWDAHMNHEGKTTATAQISLPISSMEFVHINKSPTNIIKKIILQPIDINNSNYHYPSESYDTNPNIFSIRHETRYHYQSPVHFSRHLFRLQPVSDLEQFILSYTLEILANGHPINDIGCHFTGAFGNNATICEISEPYEELVIISKSVICVSNQPKKRFDLLSQKHTIPLIWMPWDRIMMQAYLVPPELPESELHELSEYAKSFVKRNNNNILESLNDICRTLYNDYAYTKGATNLNTTPYQVYADRKGVCQDFANLFICLARLMNIPARYRVGYIYTATTYDNKSQSDESHAWVEVYLPSIGWIGYDPTNCCFAEKNHIRVACGRNFRDASPTSGTIYKGGGHESLETSVKVALLDPTNIQLDQ